MPTAVPWNAQLAGELIAAEIAAARAFYGDDGEGSTAMLPILHALQQAFACVPPDAVPVIAQALNVSKAEVRGTVSFYHDFHETPSARHVLKLCRAEACQANGVERVAAHLASVHGLTPDGTVGALTLRTVYCLGNCALGPAALVDDALVAGFDEAAADALVAHSRGATV